MTDPAPKSVDGVVDELLLGDGFSIVDSTNAKSEVSPPVKEAEKPKKSTKPTAAEKKPDPKSEPPKSKPDPVTAPDPKPTKEKPQEKVVSKTQADETKINGHDPKSDALLITTEEDLEITSGEKKSDDPSKNEPSDEKSKKEDDAKDKIDKKKTGDVWVSNITRHIKATDLKKHFTRHGKVLTAKIVTNGRSFFGYILMESPEIANKCVRSLHGTMLDGRKLSVSRQRPDAQRKSIPDRRPVKTAKIERKVEKKDAGTKSEEKKIEKLDTKKDEALKQAKKLEEKLRRDIDYLRRESTRLKRQVTEEQRRCRAEQNKTRALGRELQEAENKLKDERRKFDREREVFEKTSRNDRVRLEADRSSIKKELDEVKKLREYLKRKIDEDQTRTAERERERERRPRASSPYAYSSKRFRGDSGEKNSKYIEERNRTPPSPPKLSSRKRSPERSFPIEKERSRHYEISNSFEKDRHSSSIVTASKVATPAPPRNIWPSAFHQEVWRMAPGASSGGPFSSSGQYSRQSDYSSTSSSKPASYSQSSRDFNKRDHYSSSSLRKY